MILAAARRLGIAFVYEESVRETLTSGAWRLIIDDWFPTIPSFFP